MQITESVIAKCKAKDRSAQQLIYKSLLPYLKPIAARYLRNNQYVLDVLQESFVKLFREIDRYDQSKGSLKSWATKIVINTALNYNNRIIGINTKPIQEEIDILTVQAQEDKESLTKKQLLMILRNMPKGYFEVFNLFVIDGYDHEEISEILGIQSSLSRKKLSRAREWLRKSNFMEKIIALFIFINVIWGL